MMVFVYVSIVSVKEKIKENKRKKYKGKKERIKKEIKTIKKKVTKKKNKGQNNAVLLTTNKSYSKTIFQINFVQKFFLNLKKASFIKCN